MTRIFPLVAFVVALSAQAGVVVCPPGQTPVSPQCAAELLAECPGQAELVARVCFSSPLMKGDVAALIDTALGRMYDDVAQFQQIVFEHRKSIFADDDYSVRVTFHLLPPGETAGANGMKIAQPSPGHLIVGLARPIVPHSALEETFRKAVVARVAELVRRETPGQLDVLREARFASSFESKLLSWVDSDTTLEARFRVKPKEGETVELAVRLVDGGKRPTVETRGRWRIVYVSAKTLEEWRQAIHFADDVAQIASYLSLSIFGGDAAHDLPVRWTIPLHWEMSADPSSTNQIRRQLGRNRHAPVLAAAKLEGPVARQLEQLAATFIDLERAGFTNRIIKIPTPQGDRYVVPTPVFDDAIPKELIEVTGVHRGGDYGLKPHYGPQYVVSRLDELAIEGLALDHNLDHTAYEQLRLMQRLADFLGLTSSEAQRQLVHAVFHRAVLRGIDAFDFDTRDVRFPSWMRQVYADRTRPASWLDSHSPLALASKDRSNWPWAVALLPRDQRAAYVGWLHSIPAERAERLVEKLEHILATMTAEQVDAKLRQEDKP